MEGQGSNTNGQGYHSERYLYEEAENESEGLPQSNEGAPTFTKLTSPAIQSTSNIHDHSFEVPWCPIQIQEIENQLEESLGAAPVFDPKEKIEAGSVDRPQQTTSLNNNAFHGTPPDSLSVGDNLYISCEPESGNTEEETPDAASAPPADISENVNGSVQFIQVPVQALVRSSSEAEAGSEMVEADLLISCSPTIDETIISTTTTGESAGQITGEFTSQNNVVGLINRSNGELISLNCVQLINLCNGEFIIQDNGEWITLNAEELSGLNNEELGSLNNNNGGLTPHNNGELTPPNNGDLTPSNNGDLTPSNNGELTPPNNGELVPQNTAQLLPRRTSHVSLSPAKKSIHAPVKHGNDRRNTATNSSSPLTKKTERKTCRSKSNTKLSPGPTNETKEGPNSKLANNAKKSSSALGKAAARKTTRPNVKKSAIATASSSSLTKSGRKYCIDGEMYNLWELDNKLVPGDPLREKAERALGERERREKRKRREKEQEEKYRGVCVELQKSKMENTQLKEENAQLKKENAYQMSRADKAENQIKLLHNEEKGCRCQNTIRELAGLIKENHPEVLSELENMDTNMDCSEK